MDRLSGSWRLFAGFALCIAAAAGCSSDGIFGRMSPRSPGSNSCGDGCIPSRGPIQVLASPAAPQQEEFQWHPVMTTATDRIANDGNVVPAGYTKGPNQAAQQPLPQPKELKVPPPQELLPDPKLKGKTVALVLDDVEIAKALDLLAKEGPLNILISPLVTGRVTANLKGMTLEQALESLLKVGNLVAVREKGLVYVYTADEKLPMRIYHLSYARAQDLEKMIKSLLSPKGKITVTPPSAVGITSPSPVGGGSPGGGGGGTAGGTSITGGDSLSVGGSIIVQDYESVLTAVDRVVAELDVQPVQVLIEAVILVVNLNKGQELGINFAVLNSAGTLLSVVGNGSLLNQVVGFLPGLAQASGLASTGFAANQYTSPQLAPPASPNPGFFNNANGLSVGGANRNVAAFIQALDSIGETEVLATPRLLVLNKQLAEIKLSQQLGYSTFSQSAISTVQQVQFLDVGTQLRVRPFISPDGMVRMEIHPERSSGSVVNNVPNTSTASVTSNLMVPDGATIVIGGLMEKIPTLNQTGIPYLSRIPYIGALFRDRITSNTRNELIVLLTPRIWNPNCPEGLNTAGNPPVPVTPLPGAPDPRLFP